MSEKKKECVVIPLTIPATLTDKNGKETIVTELTLSRIKLKALKKLPLGSLEEEGTYASIIPLIAASADVPIELVEEIDFSDLRTITEAIEPFLPKSP